MKKVEFWYGGEIELDSWKCIWHLRPGDIIKSDHDPSTSIPMEGRRLVVEGFKRNSDRNFTVWVRPEERKRVVPYLKPEGLILKSRPGMKFKVGDLVKDSQIGEMKGTVIVICPEKRRRRPYLVEYSNAHTGYGSSDQYDKPWFPSDYMRLRGPKNRQWCSEEMLTFL